MTKQTKTPKRPLVLTNEVLPRITGGTFPHLSTDPVAGDPPTEITADPPSERVLTRR